MSAPPNDPFHQDVKFFQRLMKSAGFYKGPLDGKWGAGTEAASDAFDEEYRRLRNEMGEFDPRSEGIIATLMPNAQIKAREFMRVGRVDFPLTLKLLSGTRTYAEQNALYEKKPKVTNAKGGHSNHNFGIAWDVGIFDNGKYFTGANSKEEKAYADLGKLIKAKVLKVEWGGDWTKFKDMPHYQLATGKSVSECRAALETGKAFA